MVSMQLGTVWLNDAADLSDALAVEYVTGIEYDPTQNGEVRTYAGGRLRDVSWDGDQANLTLGFGLMTRPAVKWIERHAGKPIVVRDPVGRKFFGVYRNPKITERRGENQADVSLTVQQTSASELV
jgi:hypothetical protein